MFPIIHVLPEGVSPCSGAVPAILGLAVALGQRGRRVEVWHYGEWPGRGDWASKAIESESLELHRIDPDGPAGFDGQLNRLLTQHPEAVVHLHNVLTPRNPRLARRLRKRGQRYLVSPHGTCAPEMERKNWFLKKVYKTLAGRPMLSGAVAAFALSAKEEEDLRRYGYRGPIRQVPNGVRAPELSAADAQHPSEISQSGRFVQTGSAPLALYAGRLELDYKRLDLMVRAMVTAQDWHLAFAGIDWQESEDRLKRLAADVGVGDRVHFLGPLFGEELWKTYRRADLFLLLSKSEGLSMALLEALACGTPALLSTEVARTIDLGCAGWTCLPEEAGSALEQLGQQSPEQWSHRRAAALELARQFDWSTIAQRYDQALDQVLRSEAVNV